MTSKAQPNLQWGHWRSLYRWYPATNHVGYPHLVRETWSRELPGMGLRKWTWGDWISSPLPERRPAVNGTVEFSYYVGRHFAAHGISRFGHDAVLVSARQYPFDSPGHLPSSQEIHAVSFSPRTRFFPLGIFTRWRILTGDLRPLLLWFGSAIMLCFYPDFVFHTLIIYASSGTITIWSYVCCSLYGGLSVGISTVKEKGIVPGNSYTAVNGLPGSWQIWPFSRRYGHFR